MSADKKFPIQRDGHLYMCEGGTETEFMYKHGFELPHFATFPLLENPKAASVLRDMYRSYLDVTARHGMSAIMGAWTTEQVQIGALCLDIPRKGLPMRITKHWISLKT